MNDLNVMNQIRFGLQGIRRGEYFNKAGELIARDERLATQSVPGDFDSPALWKITIYSNATKEERKALSLWITRNTNIRIYQKHYSKQPGEVDK